MDQFVQRQETAALVKNPSGTGEHGCEQAVLDIGTEYFSCMLLNESIQVMVLTVH